MSRRVRFVLVAGIVAISALVMSLPASAATIVHFDSASLVSHGRSVDVAATISCDPQPGASNIPLGVVLFQGKAGDAKIEGFGGIGVEGVDGLRCDGASHPYVFTVDPTQFFAGKRFHAGPAGIQWVIQVCTEVAPGDTVCTILAQGEQRVKIRP